MLATEEDAAKIDAEWERHNKHSSFNLPEKDAIFHAERAALQNKFGGPPKDTDVFWSLIQKERTGWAAARDWQLYRLSCFKLAGVLLLEDRFEQAIPHLIDVCLLDCWIDEQNLSESLLVADTDPELIQTAYLIENRLASGVVSLLLDSMKRAEKSEEDLLKFLANRWAKLPMLANWSIDLRYLSKAIQSFA